MSTDPTGDGDYKQWFTDNKESFIGIGLTFGAGMGIVIGAATDNIGVGIAIGGGVGLSIGAAIYAALSAQETE